MKLLRPVEAALLGAGIVLIGIYGWMRADAAIGSAVDVESFEAMPDTRLWSQSRLRRYHESAPVPKRLVIGVLRIPSLDLRVPIYPDTSEAHLNRGVGLIAAMARPGEGGNLGIAGHRDGFFRVLADIEAGETIEVRTRERSFLYRVTGVTIVDESDNALLRRTQRPTITLVTCYPFYLVGRAPQRFVVRGELAAVEPASADSRRATPARRGA